MFVKICGITNELDARIAIEAGADAVGLILAESPRRVEPETARRIVASLPEDALTVAVFRREDPERVLRAFRAIGAKAVQIHDPSPEALVHLRKRVPFLIEAVAAGDDLPERAERTPADLLLVDAAEPGSGGSFDWSLLDPAPPGVKVVLAGGLTPDNVADAVRRVGPWGVDVSSGVEVEPGRKDHRKVRLFVERARAARAPRMAEER
ncbi:MAG TPA: phosphoribosylanthranilate isomerase [Actinomycetota bacterium]